MQKTRTGGYVEWYEAGTQKLRAAVKPDAWAWRRVCEAAMTRSVSRHIVPRNRIPTTAAETRGKSRNELNPSVFYNTDNGAWKGS